MCLINALACVCVFMTIKVNVTTSTVKVIWGHLNPFSWLMVSSAWLVQNQLSLIPFGVRDMLCVDALLKNMFG